MAKQVIFKHDYDYRMRNQPSSNPSAKRKMFAIALK